MSAELVGISVYILGMLILGHVVSKRIKTDTDYFLAGRSLGPVLATFSIFATWFGAETCIGTAGKVYRQGLSGAHADPFTYALCIFLMGFVFSRILWRKKITTIPDLFRARFGPRAEILGALIMIPSSLVWAGAQIRAFGEIIHVTTDYGVVVAVTVAALVVITYTISGGLLADAYTDLIQGGALIVGLVVLLCVMLLDLGGVSAAVAQVPQLRLDFFRSDPGVSTLAAWEMWLVPLLGSLMAQELVSRMSASRSESVAFHSSWRAGLLYLVVGLMPVMIGLLGRMYYPELESTDSIMPLLAKRHLGLFLYVIFVGALVSAILSTVDSTLLAISALVTHNLVFPRLPQLSDERRVFFARLGVFVSGLLAYLIAFSSDSVTELVETASSLGGPTILVIVSFALFSKFGSQRSAVAAMVASVLTWFLGHFVFAWEAPVLATVGVCLGTYVLVGVFEKTGRGVSSPR